MERDGYRLEVIRHPADFKANRGQTFTARFTRGNEMFEARDCNNEVLAFLLAALKTRSIDVEGRS
jgi:hypothetical protein